jgi:hypothetical protein
MLTLIDVIKSASSAVATVSPDQVGEGHRKVEDRKHNKVMPWLSGRKPQPRKKEKEAATASKFEQLSRAETRSPGKIERRRRQMFLKKRRSFNPALLKSSIYPAANYHGMGGTPHPGRMVYNQVLEGLTRGAAGMQHSAKPTLGQMLSTSMPQLSRMLTAPKAAPSAAAATPAATPTAALPKPTWGMFWRDPARFSDTVLAQYNAQKPWQRALGDVSAGASLAAWGPGSIVPRVGAGLTGYAGGAAGGGPSAIDKALAIPAGAYSTVQDVAQAKKNLTWRQIWDILTA